MVLQVENALLNRQECEHRPEQPVTASEAVKVIYIQATVGKLDYPLIPFAVLKQDPMVAARQYLEEQSYSGEGKEISEEQLYDAWNSLFTELMPEKHFFLYAWASVPGVSSAILRTMGLIFMVATPGPSYTRWLTTRPVWYQGALVAWSVPLDMRHVEQEQVERVLLSENNMLCFTSSASWLQQMSEPELEKEREKAEHRLYQCSVIR